MNTGDKNTTTLLLSLPIGFTFPLCSYLLIFGSRDTITLVDHIAQYSSNQFR